ncbi:MAG TPA: efflux RND transporter periplasmic adaptor subunit [Anaerolineae bacterium]|nr:efflux RND transporter periplasmic adaptor subunit [Anaerolineae bacterium]
MERTEIRKRNPEFTGQVADGIDALRAGRRAEAQRTLARAVRADTENATAWYWLGRSLDDEGERAECMDRVRRLDRARPRGVQEPPPGPPALPCQPSVPLGRRRLTRRGRWAAALALLVVAITCLAAPLLRWQPTQARAAGHEPLEASGTIHAPEIELASEYGGRIDAILFRSGENVEAGQVLVRLATDLLDAQIEAARAAVDLAGAGLAQARAGARPGQIAVAEAQLAKAEAARVVAAQAVSDTAMLVAHPQEVDLQIAVTQAQARAAEHKLAHALALKDAAEIGKDRFYEAQSALREAGGPGDRRIRAKIAEGSFDEIVARLPPEMRDRLPSPPGDGTIQIQDFEIEVRGTTYALYRWVTVNINLPFEAHLAPNVWWQAWVGVNAASAEVEGLAASLGTLYDQRSHPQDSLARADQAAATLTQAEAQLAAAQAQLDGLRAGAMPEQIGVLEAKVEQARAALDALLTQREQMTLTAPSDGIVVSLAAHEGEIAAPGAPLLTLAHLDRVVLTVYVPETELGQIGVGQAVHVHVDSFPERIYEGTVLHIAHRAEFTPRNVSTKEERANLVFAVEIDLPNEERTLKPGMPADAAFGP